MTKKLIKIQFKNGLSFHHFKRDVFDINRVTESLDFIESENPDFIVFGPYGNDIPPKGNYVRIGYFCENILPDLSICEWAFGIPSETEINDRRYKRIQWHGLDPKRLVKNIKDNDIDRLCNEKTKFCNFLFSNPVSYREKFFKQLSKYKKIDSPGKSMNNMASIDKIFEGNVWERKRKFITPYKFTIAFENYVYPGYQTEKLYDAMQCLSLPIYCGDPNISEIFDTNSFINVPDYIHPNESSLVKILENASQQNFKDYRPSFYQSFPRKIIRKLKLSGRDFKMRIQFNKLDFSELIDRIIEIDRDIDLYKKYLTTPYFVNNDIPKDTLNGDRWKEIFINNTSE